jgi:hypothetical protein
MKPDVLATITQLQDIDWVSTVGAPYTGAAHVLPSWDAAVSEYRANGEALREDGCSELLDGIRAVDVRRSRQWNEMVGRYRPIARNLADRAAMSVVAGEDTRQIVGHIVANDLCLFLINVEALDLVPLGVFGGFAYYYKIGRFPARGSARGRADDP